MCPLTPRTLPGRGAHCARTAVSSGGAESDEPLFSRHVSETRVRAWGPVLRVEERVWSPGPLGWGRRAPWAALEAAGLAPGHRELPRDGHPRADRRLRGAAGRGRGDGARLHPDALRGQLCRWVGERPAPLCGGRRSGPRGARGAELSRCARRRVGGRRGPDGWGQGPAGGHAPCLRRHGAHRGHPGKQPPRARRGLREARGLGTYTWCDPRGLPQHPEPQSPGQ